jgi:hypothetical protein
MKLMAISLWENIKEKIVWFFLALFGIWVIGALSFMLYMGYLELSGNKETMTNIGNQLTWKFDGTFKNDPNNIFYNAEEHIYVQNVTNNIKVGKLTGNRNLEFGVKNILEEFLQEKGYDLTPDAKFYLDVDIVYLDVLTTKQSISVFHKDDNAVVIRLKGTLYNEGKKVKEVLVEESSSEISVSTLIVDEGGKFNQASLSSALKKGCDKLITKLFDK